MKKFLEERVQLYRDTFETTMPNSEVETWGVGNKLKAAVVFFTPERQLLAARSRMHRIVIFGMTFILEYEGFRIRIPMLVAKWLSPSLRGALNA